LFFVPVEAGTQIVLEAPAKNDRQLSSSSTYSSQHLLHRQYIVWTLTMFGKRLINGCAMGVTHRESGRASGKAFPKKLEQAELLFGGQLEEFSNVGVTHNV